MSLCLGGVFKLLKKVTLSVFYQLFKIFNLCQSCSPLVDFFWFVPGFVEGDQTSNLNIGFLTIDSLV